VSTVASNTAAGGVREAEKGSDDVDLSVSTDSQDPLEVRDSRRHSDLMSHYKLTNHVEFFIVELGYLRDDAIAVCLTTTSCQGSK
jgi:hypothetical protein